MNILLIDNGVTGHHITYMRAIIEGCKDTHSFIVFIPEKINELNDCKQYKFSEPFHKVRNYRTYNAWLKEINEIIIKEHVDIVHFLEGDALYKFFGLKLNTITKGRTIITFHRLREGKLYSYSLLRITRNMDSVVVHSNYIRNEFLSRNINNVTHIEYPQFSKGLICGSDAKKTFKLKEDIPVIGCLGATRAEKGLDILLDALKSVTKPFQLLIAGMPVSFDESFILKETSDYSKSVHLYLKFMSEDEFNNALCACDIICLPYRKTFNGASGPLGEGVSQGCCIIGPNHGNLGETISYNHLGFTFTAEDSHSLSEAITKALDKPFVVDNKYADYKRSLNPSFFAAKYKALYESVL